MKYNSFSSFNFLLPFFFFESRFPLRCLLRPRQELDDVAFWAAESRHTGGNREQEPTRGVSTPHYCRSFGLCKSWPCKLHSASRTRELIHIFRQAHQGCTVRLPALDEGMRGVASGTHRARNMTTDLDHSTAATALQSALWHTK